MQLRKHLRGVRLKSLFGPEEKESPVKTDTSASVGLEMAQMRQLRREGKNVPDEAFRQALSRMLLSEATTTGDALALLVHAQMLLAVPLADLPEPKSLRDAHLIHYINDLVLKAVEALEVASGERRGVYWGKAPTIN